MDRETLFELWDRNKDRPQFVRAHRDEFAEHLSETTARHLPAPDASTFEYRQFINDYAGVVTRQLNDDAGGTDPTDDADAEPEVEA
jgi:hypothetical protein